ncbi:MAG: GWxTD domain-containing protein [Saprospiraceae bacterium]|nr:GWxTD domain-containing protein [Saprospiraceae bacterium]
MKYIPLFKSRSILLVISCILGLSSCTIQTHRQLYHKELSTYGDIERTVHYQIIHQGDSSFLYLKAGLEDYIVTCRAYEQYDAKNLLFEKRVEIEDEQKGTLQRISLETNAATYACEIIISATYNPSVALYHDISFVNNIQDNWQSIYITDLYKNPILRKYLHVNEEFKIYYKKNVAQKFYVKYRNIDFRPSPPPFSKNYSLYNPLKDYDELYVVKAGQTLKFSEEGSYFIQTDTSSNKGVFVNCFNTDYPKVTRLKDLILSMRYITRNNEYERMNNAKDKKAELDNYWLKRAGNNKKNARYLLQTYFNRIEQANIYFTTYKEGWKTDRGLIYTIFGEPQTIRKYSNKEIWYYSSNYRRPPIELVFTRVGEQYILERDQDYQTPWGLEVYNWRKGNTRYIR